MKTEKLKILWLFGLFFLLTVSVFGKTNEKVLIYYFKNLTGDKNYNDLIYSIPVCVYEHIGEENDEHPFSVIDDRAYQEYLETETFDLWDSDFILKITRDKQIDRVLYGYFYKEGDQLRIRGKIYFTDSGLILDVTEDSNESFAVLGEIEGLEVEVIRQCSAASEAKPYKIPVRYIGDKESSRSKRVLNISAGAVRPTQEWGDLYSFGIYGDISYTIFAKRNRIPLGVGPQGGVIVLRRKEDGDFIGSNLAIIPLGGTIKYVILGKNLKDRLVVDLGAGLAVSILNINHDSENSVDFYSRGSLNLMFNLWKNNQLALTAGLFSVAYDETPLNAIFGEIGVRSNFF